MSCIALVDLWLCELFVDALVWDIEPCKWELRTFLVHIAFCRMADIKAIRAIAECLLRQALIKHQLNAINNLPSFTVKDLYHSSCCSSYMYMSRSRGRRIGCWFLARLWSQVTFDKQILIVWVSLRSNRFRFYVISFSGCVLTTVTRCANPKGINYGSILNFKRRKRHFM